MACTRLGALQHGTRSRHWLYLEVAQETAKEPIHAHHIDQAPAQARCAKSARAAAQKIAKDLNKRYGLICQWDGDEVTFDGVGVSGNMQVGKSQIKLDVQLSFLLAPLKGPIEREINKQLDTLLVKA